MVRIFRDYARTLRRRGKAGRLLYATAVRLWRLGWRILGVLAWPFPAVAALLRWSCSSEKRILAVWDTAAQPYSLGDMLVFQEATLLLRRIHGVEKVDLCILSDEHDYKVGGREFDEISSGTRLRYILALLRVVQVNPHLGSLIVLDSRRQFEAFIGDNCDKYYLWPPVGAYVAREYLYYRIFEMLARYYRKTGEIPRLAAGLAARQRAREFIVANALPYVPVVVQLRQNPGIDVSRNSDLVSWVALFDYCREKYPVKFMVISAQEELDRGVIERPNVILTKSFATTVEEDLALIEASAFFMSVSSGLCAMAIFSRVPYAVVKFVMGPHHPDLFPAIVSDERGLHFIWATPEQRLVVEPDSVAVLIREFERLYAAVDRSAWTDHGVTAGSGPRPTLRLW